MNFDSVFFKRGIVTNVHTLENSELFDLLSQETTIYTRLLADRNRNDEYNRSKEMIKLLQAEIEFRKTKVDIPVTPLQSASISILT